MITQQKQAILKAINDLGRRVTAADVAAKTGMPILRVTSELNKIAQETQGHLEVATTGDIAYRFSPAFQTAYLTTGYKRALERAMKWTLKIGGFILRISFGIGLILSVVILAILFFVVILALSKARGDGDFDFDIPFDFDFFDFLILRELFFWGVYSSTYNNYDYYGYGQSSRQRPQRGSGNFLFNCFSFLFGDGNPNRDFEDRKWQTIAQVIRQNGGSVTAEQIAPFTKADPKNEDGMLPVLVRFDGRPEVTESGNIIYQFPSLQVKAASDSIGHAPSYMEERKWPFSNVPFDNFVPVLILAAVNFFGAWWAIANVGLINALTGLGGLVVFLFLYGNAFLVVPAIRALVLMFVNQAIDSRNSSRQQLAAVLQHPSAELSRKLAEAKGLKINEERIGTEDLVYTTEKDSLDQKDDLDRQFEAMGSGPIIIDGSDVAAPKRIEAKPAETIDGATIEIGGVEQPEKLKSKKFQTRPEQKED